MRGSGVPFVVSVPSFRFVRVLVVSFRFVVPVLFHFGSVVPFVIPFRFVRVVCDCLFDSSFVSSSWLCIFLSLWSPVHVCLFD